MYRLIVTRPDGTRFQSDPEPLADRHETGLAVLRVLAAEGVPFTVAAKRFGALVRDADLGDTNTHEPSGYQFRTEEF